MNIKFTVNKFCSNVAKFATEPVILEFLKKALAGDKDSWMLFLDQLEIENPRAKKEVISFIQRNNLQSMFRRLKYYFPEIVPKAIPSFDGTPILLDRRFHFPKEIKITYPNGDVVFGTPPNFEDSESYLYSGFARADDKAEDYSALQARAVKDYKYLTEFYTAI